MCKIPATTLGIKHSLQWYYDRVGKRLIRKNGSCKMQHCIEARTTGLKVHSRLFAEYLHVMQQEKNYRYEEMEELTLINQPV